MSKTSLVIGASENPERYSNKAILSLLERGHKVLAIGSRAGEVAGVKWDKELKDWGEDIDTVTLYINSKIQQLYYDYIQQLKPKRVIFNPGTENPEWMKELESQGIEVLPACTLVLLSIGSY